MMRIGFISTAALTGFAVALALAAGCSGIPATTAAPPNGAGAPGVHALDVTPTPTPTPIQLYYGTSLIGTPTWPEGDTATGGQGQQVDKIFNCLASMSGTYHHHAQLSIFVNGVQLMVPRGIGMKNPGTNSFVYHATCYYRMHVHDSTGIIHMESNVVMIYTLGNFFDLWGEPFSNDQIAQFTGPVALYVNGVLNTTYADIRTVVVNPGDDITLVIGTPPSWIPAYLLPVGYET